MYFRAKNVDFWGWGKVCAKSGDLMWISVDNGKFDRRDNHVCEKVHKVTVDKYLYI